MRFDEKKKTMLYKSMEEALNRRQLLNTTPTVMTYSKVIGTVFGSNARPADSRENEN